MNKKGDYGGFLLVLMFILLFTIIIFFVLCSKGTLSCEFCDDNFGLDIECEEEEEEDFEGEEFNEMVYYECIEDCGYDNMDYSNPDRPNITLLTNCYDNCIRWFGNE